MSAGTIFDCAAWQTRIPEVFLDDSAEILLELMLFSNSPPAGVNVYNCPPSRYIDIVTLLFLDSVCNGEAFEAAQAGLDLWAKTTFQLQSRSFPRSCLS